MNTNQLEMSDLVNQEGEIKIFLDEEEITIINVGHLDEVIETLENQKFPQKISKAYKEHIHQLNALYKLANTLAGYKRYNHA